MPSLAYYNKEPAGKFGGLHVFLRCFLFSGHKLEGAGDESAEVGATQKAVAEQGEAYGHREQR